MQVRVFDLLQAPSLLKKKKNPKQNQTNKALVTSLGRTVLGIWACTVTPFSLSFFRNDFVWRAGFFFWPPSNRNVILRGNGEYLNVMAITGSCRCILPCIGNCLT